MRSIHAFRDAKPWLSPRGRKSIRRIGGRASNNVAEFAPGQLTAPIRRYAHGPGVDEPLIWYEGSGVASGQNWLIADRQGSIIATTNASGTATTYGYDPYGVPREWTGQGGAMLSRFRYTGQAVLPELRLYHYKARVYDPSLGRFLQTDPVGYDDDLNLYAYVRNDPLNGADPSGRQRRTDDPDLRVPIPEQPVHENYADAARNGARLIEQTTQEMKQGSASGVPGTGGDFELTVSIRQTTSDTGEPQHQVTDMMRSPDGSGSEAGHRLRTDGTISGTVHPHNPQDDTLDRLNQGPNMDDRQVARAGRDLRRENNQEPSDFHLTIITPEGGLVDYLNGRGPGVEIDPPGTYDVD